MGRLKMQDISDIRAKLVPWKFRQEKMVRVKMRDNPGVRMSKSLAHGGNHNILTRDGSDPPSLSCSQLHAANIHPRRNCTVLQSILYIAGFAIQ